MKKIGIILLVLISATNIASCFGADETTDTTDKTPPTVTIETQNTEVDALEGLKIEYTASDDVTSIENLDIVVTVFDSEGEDVTLSTFDAETNIFCSDYAGTFYIRVTVYDEEGNSKFAQISVVVKALPVAPMEKYVLPTAPSFGSDVSCHDPSIFKDDDGTYYTFGSHFDVKKSTDLLKWTNVTSGNNSAKAGVLYGGNWKTVIADAVAHVGNDASSTWAPDVIKLNGKYYMYYSLSTFGSSTSYIGRVEADAVTGPYSNSVEIVKSSGGTNNPNAIDANIFYDKDGGLWMSYGSFFGGIFILELENSGENIGLPKAGQGFGKRIWQGSITDGPEGPYIFYNEDTDYYYMMVSFASLSENYNMRVVRSKNPDGPYVDARNIEVQTTNGGGVKYAGNYQFAGTTRGYAALGHNSVLKEDGKYFVIYHTRFRQGTSGVSGGHNQYVNQLFFNEQGWPVMAPNRYAGESLGRVEAEDILGEYDLIVHSGGNSAAFVESSVYKIVAGGSVTKNGTVCGSWELRGNYFINLTVEGKLFRGVVAPQWLNDFGSSNRAALSITAISNDGISLWANGK